MAILSIKGTVRTPSIHFDDKTGKLQIAGRSLPRNPVIFYKPVIAWVQAYAKRPESVAELVLSFEYLDVGSSKQMLDIIAPLKKIKHIKVIWYYSQSNEAMREVGEDLSELLDIPFEYQKNAE